MSRSAEPLRRSLATLAATSAISALLALGPGTAGAATLEDVDAAVLDVVIEGTVLDIATTTSTLDGSLADTVSGTTRTLTLSADVLFAFDRADLGPEAASRLDEVASQLDSAAGPVAVDGYTDARGEEAYNLRLSQQRADTVAAALRERLGTGVELAARGHGEADPVAPNTTEEGADDPQGRALNRRVTVTLGGR